MEHIISISLSLGVIFINYNIYNLSKLYRILNKEVQEMRQYFILKTEHQTHFMTTMVNNISKLEREIETHKKQYASYESLKNDILTPRVKIKKNPPLTLKRRGRPRKQIINTKGEI